MTRKPVAYTITTDVERQTDVRLVRVLLEHFTWNRGESIDDSSSRRQSPDVARGGKPDATHGPVETSDLATNGQECQKW